MTNRTDEALRRTMTAIIDSAPEAPDMPVAPANAARTGAWAPRLAAASAFALVLVVGIGIALVSGGQVDRSRVGSSQATTYEAIASDLGASPMPDAEIKRIAGGEIGLVPGSGYGINRISVDELGATLGLAMYQDRSLEGETVHSCFIDYAVIDGFYVEGSGACAPTLQQAVEIAVSSFSVTQVCGPIPMNPSKPDSLPRLEADWTLVSVWGVPTGVSVVEVGLGDGTVEALEVSDSGVAQMLWNGLPGISSLQFDGMTAKHESQALAVLPIRPTDCSY